MKRKDKKECKKCGIDPERYEELAKMEIMLQAHDALAYVTRLEKRIEELENVIKRAHNWRPEHGQEILMSILEEKETLMQVLAAQDKEAALS